MTTPLLGDMKPSLVLLLMSMILCAPHISDLVAVSLATIDMILALIFLVIENDNHRL
ncbi:hypothetical protein UFOVP138_36 [uncultured Caudovirales phage]|uniref:Uncharacterized protein n=1 Tax=uncultured Caudovirales phage TaxID=2100421 RepID=A0A6J5LG60_9CAUD|nr:hypothetical protein UFOVP138_36 [uncultured Caudovirales phage]